MAQKAVRSEASATELPGSRTGLARGAWGGMSSPNRTLLATGKMGSGREWGGRGVAQLSSHGPENPEEKEIALSLKRWEQKQNETEDSPPGPPPGEGAALFLAVSWERANSNISGLPASGPLRRLCGHLGPGWDAGGARSPARGLDATGLCVDSAWGGASSGGRRRAPTATGRLRPGPGGSGGMVQHAGAGCAGSPRSAAVPPRTAGRSPQRCRRTALPGRWGHRKSVPCRRPSSLPGWARDGAPGPPWWTSPSRGTTPWLSSLVERSQSPCAAPASTPGRYYPRAPVWAPWLGEPAG